jgi:hypothetical protein
MVEPDDPRRKRRSELVLIRGAPIDAIDALVLELDRTHAPVEASRRDPGASTWFGRIHFEPAHLDSPSGKALAGLSDLIGPPWVHVEAGVVLLRARLRDDVNADDAVERVQKAMAAAGLDAQVVVQEIAPRDHSVWEDLVQHGIGLTL